MQTISSIARELEAQGLLNKEALRNLRKWQWKQYRGFLILFVIVSCSLMALGARGSAFAVVAAITLGLMLLSYFTVTLKKVRLYTFGEKVPGTFVKLTYGLYSFCFYYQFESKKGNVISTREGYNSGKLPFRTTIPFTPNQAIEVLYNPKNLRESTVFMPEFNSIFNLKRES